MRMLVRAVLVASAGFVLQSLSLAGTLTVSSSGMFSSGAPITTWSAPSTTWSFSFNISSTPGVSNADSNGFDTTFSAFSYSLGGGSVATTPTRIRFFSTAASGLLEINFVDGSMPEANPDTGFIFSGSQAFSGSTSSPTVLANSYPSTGAFFYSAGSPVDSFPGAIVNIMATAGGASSVPEPATLTLVAAGLLLAGWMRRGLRTR